MDCPWPVSFEQCGPCPALEELDDEGRDRWGVMAGEFLWRWTGRKFGRCSVTVRPCRDRGTKTGSTFWGRGPYLDGWRPAGVSCWVCGPSCGCDAPTCLRLPGPVGDVTDVTVDGVTLDPSTWRVEGPYLIRLDGGWPATQNLDLPNGSVGTWSVTYQRGEPVPPQGQVAAGVLACELAKAACGDGTCKLPQRVQTITRQGITMTVLDQMEGVDTGKTGIWLIDSFIASVTQKGGASLPRSVDVPVGRDEWT